MFSTVVEVENLLSRMSAPGRNECREVSHDSSENITRLRRKMFSVKAGQFFAGNRRERA